MGKIYGMKQRRAAEYWDTLCQGTGNMGLTASTVMFQSRNQGQKALSNLQAAGQFPSDNTFVTLALSCTTIFFHLRFAAGTVPAAGVARNQAVGTTMQPQDLQFMAELHQLTRKQCLLIYRVGEKDSYESLSDGWPAAQGTSGAVALSSAGASGEAQAAQGFFNNGTVDYGSLLRLGKPEVVAARQHFEVEARFSAQGTPGVTAAPTDVLAYLNALSPAVGLDFKHISVRVLGVHTRDVQ